MFTLWCTLVSSSSFGESSTFDESSCFGVAGPASDVVLTAGFGAVYPVEYTGASDAVVTLPAAALRDEAMFPGVGFRV